MEIKTIRIKTIGSSTEKEIFEPLKRFLIENLQHFELEVSGKKETLQHTHKVIKEVEDENNV